MAMLGLGVGVAGPSRDLLVRQAATAGFGKAAFGRVYGFVYSGLDSGLRHRSVGLRSADGPWILLDRSVRCGGAAGLGDPQRFERGFALAVYATGCGGGWVNRKHLNLRRKDAKAQRKNKGRDNWVTEVSPANEGIGGGESRYPSAIWLSNTQSTPRTNSPCLVFPLRLRAFASKVYGLQVYCVEGLQEYAKVSSHYPAPLTRVQRRAR